MQLFQVLWDNLCYQHSFSLVFEIIAQERERKREIERKRKGKRERERRRALKKI